MPQVVTYDFNILGIQDYNFLGGCSYYTVSVYVKNNEVRQNSHHFAADISKGIFFNENVWILIKVSLQFVPKGLINNNPALV